MSRANAIGKSVRACLLGLAGLGLYAAGYWHGGQTPDAGDAQHSRMQQRVAPGMAQPPPETLFRQSAAERGPGAAMDDEFARLLAQGAWFALERWLSEHQNDLTERHGQALHDTLAGRLNKYDALAMRRILQAYLVAQPGDTVVLFLLADLQQMSGMPEAALESLFKILDFPVQQAVAERARREVDQILSVVDAGFKGRAALAEREAFWRHVSARMPSSDYFRYQWAGALAATRQYAQALRILAETGSSDVEPADVERLRQRIETAARGVEFQRDGDRMLATAYTLNGTALTLLVDTGANITTLTQDVLRTTSARRLRRKATVRTASGVVDAAVYEVPLLDIHGHRFENVQVLELPVELPGLDGLLGLDLVDRITRDPFGTAADGP